jgi:heavy metal translocating P-type ATPase
MSPRAKQHRTDPSHADEPRTRSRSRRRAAKHQNRLHYRVVHYTPGRIRFYIPALEDNAGVSARFEHAYHEADGVDSIRGNPATGSLLISYDPAKTSLAWIMHNLLVAHDQNDAPAGKETYGAGPVCVHCRSAAHLEHEPVNLKRKFIGVIVTGLILGLVGFQGYLARFIPGLARLPGLWIAAGTAVVAGIPVFREGWDTMREEKRLNLDFLVSMAGIASIAAGQAVAALEVVWLMNCGTLLEHYTADRSRRAIKDLLSVDEDYAWLVKDGVTIQVALEKVQAGDVIAIHTGEKVLVDGEVVWGQAAVNQAAINGESMPAEKKPGDAVFAGTLVDNGIIHVRADKVGDATYLARVLHMVEESLEQRAPIQRISDTFATWFVPSAVAAAVLVLLVTRNFMRGLTVLVVSCPCAAAIATPTAISAAVGNGAKRNMLIKGGAYVEQASRIDTLCLDKTGTLTEGRPRVVNILRLAAAGYGEDELIALAASAEMRSSHPLAHALLREAEARKVRLIEPAHFVLYSGSGLEASLQNGQRVLVGSRRLMEVQGVAVNGIDGEAERMRENGETLLYLAIDGVLGGLIGILDTPRPEARAVVQALMRQGIEIHLLTGDHRQTAEAICRSVGIERYRYDMLPEDKANYIQALRDQGRTVAMVGDGVNDALALATSDLGIAMGAGGSDVAVETADIALKSDDLTRLPALRTLSTKTMSIIRQNYGFSMGMNALGIVLGATGRMGPLGGGLLHVANSLGVILNSARILFQKDGKTP